MKKFLMMLTLALMIGACSKNDEAPMPNVEQISLDESAITLPIAGSKSLVATVSPDGANIEVVWTSANEAVATVANGVVTGVAAGETTITASAGGKSAMAKVRVLGADESSITLSVDGKVVDATTPYTIARGETMEVLAEAFPKDDEEVVIWSSEDEEVATVDRGTITAVESGETTIKATYKGAEATIKVQVVVMPTGIHLTTSFDFPDSSESSVEMINSPKSGVAVYVHIDPLDGAENTGEFELEIEDESVLEVKDGIELVRPIQFDMTPKDFTPGDKQTKVTVYYYPVPEDRSVVFSASIDVLMTDKGYQVDDKGDWEIYSAEGLYAYLVYCDMWSSTPAEIKAKAAQHVKLTKDITNTASWTPLFDVKDRDFSSGDYKEYGFSGVFDGGGHTITGIGETLFGVLSGGTVKNLNIANPDEEIVGDAGFVGEAYDGSTIENCHLKGSTTTLSGGFVGGIAGKISGGSVIKNCTNEATIEGSDRAAGIVYAMTSDADNLVVGCVNKGKITAADSAGGIVGSMYGEGVVEDCENIAQVEATEATKFQYVGGIVASSDASNRSLKAKIIDCENSGDLSAVSPMEDNVSGNSYVGGILGLGVVFEMENCHSTSDCTVAGVNAGGIVGTVLSDGSITRAKITNCSNKADVAGDKYAGGIVGMAQRATISASYSSGLGTCSDYDSSSAAYIGGVVGCSDGAEIYGCYGDSYAVRNGSNSYRAGVAGLIEDQWQTEITSCYASRMSYGGVKDDGFAHIASGASYVVRNCYTNVQTLVTGAAYVGQSSLNSASTVSNLNSGLSTHYSTFGWEYVAGANFPQLQAK